MLSCLSKVISSRSAPRVLFEIMTRRASYNELLPEGEIRTLYLKGQFLITDFLRRLKTLSRDASRVSPADARQ